MEINMKEFTYEISKYKRGKKEFSPDLKNGKLGEEDMKKFLQTLGFKFISQTIGNDNSYDLKMSFNDQELRYEIKTDTFGEGKFFSGNLVVEFESRGKPSGLFVTKAEYFTNFFPFEGEVWNIKTSDLKELLSYLKSLVPPEELYNPKNGTFYIKENGGDPNSNTKMCVINKDKFKSHFKVHKVRKI